MPIEVLKFAYTQFCTESEGENWKFLEKIPTSYWISHARNCGENAYGLASGKIEMQELNILQKLKRLQFIIDLSNCVFDKLNEHSQRNIKEVKLIFQGGATRALQAIKQLTPNFMTAAAIKMI